MFSILLVFLLWFLFNLFLIHCHVSTILPFIENNPHQRRLVFLDDPIHHVVPPTDVSNLITFCIVSSLTGLIIHECSIYSYTDLFYRVNYFMSQYGIVLTLKSIMLFCVPLEVPSDCYELRDPSLDICLAIMRVFSNAPPTHSVVAATRDLFFSGHVATVWICANNVSDSEYSGNLRFMLIMNGIIIGASLVIQRVHYTIDVIIGSIIARWVYLEALSLVNPIFVNS